MFTEGTDVRKGDLLYVIEAGEYQKAVDNAKASVASARSSRERPEVDLGHTRGYANESGRIGHTRVPQGRLVGQDGSTLLATIDRINPVYVVGTLSDRDALQQSVIASRERLRLTNLRYINGVSSHFEVLDSQRELFELELTLSQTTRAVYTSVVQLYRALGGGWDPAYDPTATSIPEGDPPLF